MQSETSELTDILRRLPATGPQGFEGLIASLLEGLTGTHFYLAKSGSQEGRDLSARSLDTNVIAVECKRYGKNTELDERELLGELVQASRTISDLDLWVLVTSRELSSQLYESINSLAEEKGIGFVAVSSSDGNPHSLEVLCSHSPETMISHPSIKGIADAQQLKALLDSIARHDGYQQRLATLQEQFRSPLTGYANWRRLNNQSFLSSLASEKEALAHYGQPINVEDSSVMLVQRAASTNSLNTWYADWENRHLFFAMLGDEGDGKSWAVASWLSAQVKSTPQFPAVLFQSSSYFSEADFDLNDIRAMFADLISARNPHVPKYRLLRLLERWLSRPAGSAPLFLLILDGINERWDYSRWRRLFERLAGDPWNKQIAVLVTSRTSYWEMYFKRLRSLPASTYVIGPYNYEELDTALAHHQLQRDSLQPTLFLSFESLDTLI